MKPGNSLDWKYTSIIKKNPTRFGPANVAWPLNWFLAMGTATDKVLHALFKFLLKWQNFPMIIQGGEEVTCATLSTPPLPAPLIQLVEWNKGRLILCLFYSKINKCALFISSCLISLHLATSTTPATSTTCTATVPPQPQYSYHDINVYSLAGLAPHITLNPTVSEHHTIPQFLLWTR